MKKYSWLWSLAVIVAIASELQAQDAPIYLQPVPERSRKYTVGIDVLSPMVFNSGVHVSFEHRVNNLRQWVQIAPTAYFASAGANSELWTTGIVDSDVSLHKANGAGLDVGYKIFFNTSEIFYCKGGISYNYFKLAYTAYDVLTHRQEDGLNYYSYDTQNVSQSFNNVGANACIGVQSTMRKARVFIDGHAGIGYTHSFYNSQKYAIHNEDHLYSYARRGLVFIIGFRVGFAFGRTKGGEE
jgi:hypothetical protein